MAARAPYSGLIYIELYINQSAAEYGTRPVQSRALEYYLIINQTAVFDSRIVPLAARPVTAHSRAH